MSFTVSQTIHANLFFRQWGQCGRVLRSFAYSFARSFTIVLCLQNFFSSYVPLIAIRIIIVFVWWIFSFQHIDTWWEYYFKIKKSDYHFHWENVWLKTSQSLVVHYLDCAIRVHRYNRHLNVRSGVNMLFHLLNCSSIVYRCDIISIASIGRLLRNHIENNLIEIDIGYGWKSATSTQTEHIWNFAKWHIQTILSMIVCAPD